MERVLRDFAAEDGSFYSTAHGHEALLLRTREGHDGALPSANAVAARALARLGHHLGRRDLMELASRAIDAYGATISRAPRAFATSLNVLERCRESTLETVAVGQPGDPGLEALLAEAAKIYLPNAARAVVSPEAAAATSAPPLVRGKGLVNGTSALYICRNFTCLAPITQPSEVVPALVRASADSRRAAFGDLDPAAVSAAWTPPGDSAKVDP